MAFDEGLAQRIREALENRTDVDEKRMFGGIAFMLGGNVCVGVVDDELMVRIGLEADRDLEDWIGRGVAFAGSLPSK